MHANRFDITDATQVVTEVLVTDTVAYEVVGRTEKTLSLRRMYRDDDNVVRQDHPGGPYPVTVYGAKATDLAPFTVRLRKDGTFRTHRSGNPLKPVDQPTFRVDYRM
jgi:hypothetical protein